MKINILAPKIRIANNNHNKIKITNLTKVIYDIGTKIIFGASVSRKPIKNWEMENVKT